MTSLKSPFSSDGPGETARLNNALNLAGVGCWELDLFSQQFWMNEQCKRSFSLAENDTVSVDEVLNLVCPDDRENVRKSIMGATTAGSEGSLDIEVRVGSDEKPYRWVNWKGQAGFGSDGKAECFSGIIVNINGKVPFEKDEKDRIAYLESTNYELENLNVEYTAINEELVHSNELLQRSNENLQQFAYVASHDLQEPLRKIISFGDLLKTRFGQELGDGSEYLDRMQVAARRMSILINDLLVFSRVNEGQIQHKSVDLNTIVSDVITDLEVSIKQSCAVVKVSELPAVKGDPRQLNQLFQNLIGNALKFRKVGVCPEIRVDWTIIKTSNLPPNVHPKIGARAYDQVSVSDNGIGFDPKNGKKIFQVFQRLHSKSEYEGTGIGLAICEKVVANHGAAIFAESEIGIGSRFSVYFPI
ncbi:PAS domain-containing sensor histidine kinase [Dyadobacter arcticus]|uniref:histidine kinase n=1 Tax=Dyadobacter arcticus TaxID=1078754 RepID=A0ABX0UQJ4_9BACT|nr:PAS domain-containing sensor histidine kinase [Dyadobacter arcticus]NIJ54374.1 signal transduction histidine kinase [Dyadobacter arcticus]